jgi:hypothetical protein
VNGGRHLI